MKTIFKFFTLLLTISMLTISCGEDTTDIKTDIEGCTDATAINYNADATIDDGSCIYTIKGCTDPMAENYNADAETDDGSCTYAWDNFIGSYIGYADCSGGPVIGNLTNDTLNYSIKSAMISGQPEAVFLTIPIQGFPAEFSATINGSVMTVDSELTDLPFENPAAPGNILLLNLRATGAMTYDQSTNSINGPVNFVISSPASGSTLDEGTCDFYGKKQ